MGGMRAKSVAKGHARRRRGLTSRRRGAKQQFHPFAVRGLTGRRCSFRGRGGISRGFDVSTSFSLGRPSEAQRSAGPRTRQLEAQREVNETYLLETVRLQQLLALFRRERKFGNFDFANDVRAPARACTYACTCTGCSCSYVKYCSQRGARKQSMLATVQAMCV